MHFNILGKTGYTVSSIAFGTWGIGGPSPNSHSYGEKDDETSKQALRHAYQLGVNLFDTSCSYGNGRAERLLGEVFREHRGRVIFATKAGYNNTPTGNNDNQSFAWDDVEHSIQTSLERLQTSYIDILQLHDCPLSAIQDNHKLFEMLERLKKEGVIRAIGFAGKSSVNTVAALNIYEFDTIQIGLSLVDMRPLDDGLIDACISRGIGLIVRSPLAFGFLTDTERNSFPDFDHRLRFSLAQRMRWANGKKKFAPVFDKTEFATWAQKSILFSLSISGVASVNVGMNNSWQVEEDVHAITLPKLSWSKIQMARLIYGDEYKNQTIERQ